MNQIERFILRIQKSLIGLKALVVCCLTTGILLISGPTEAMVIRPDLGPLTLPAQPIKLAIYETLTTKVPLDAKGSWTITTNGSGSNIDRHTGLYSPGSRPGTDTILYTDVNSQTATINVVLVSPWKISPNPASLTLPASPIQFSAFILDVKGVRHGGPGSWSLAVNGSGGTIDANNGRYTPGKTPGIDSVLFTATDGLTGSVTVNLKSPWTVSPSPGTLTLPANPIQFSAFTMDAKGVRQSGTGTWSLTVNGSGGAISASNGRYTPGMNPGTDTIVFTATDGLTGSVNLTLNSPWIITPVQKSQTHADMSIQFSAYTVDLTGVRHTGPGTWSLAVNNSGGNINASSGVYTPGINSGNDTVLFTATNGLKATYVVNSSATLFPAGSTTNTLTIDQTKRGSVGLGATLPYQAAVSSGKTYVVSLTGILGAAQLKVFNDAALTQPTACIAPDNLSNSLYRQPADCTFVATGGTVYATVTGTSYLATANNSYNIRVSPYFDAPPAMQGTETSPVEIPVNKPFGGTSGRTEYDSSYYMVNTTGRSGDVVISMTGMTGWTGGSKGDATIALSIFDNPKFNGPKLDYVSCNTPDFRTFAESCILPAGNIYYLRVTTGRAGGSFTLMVDSPPFTVAPTATPAPPATLSPSALQQAIPASTTAP